jgi:NurA domain
MPFDTAEVARQIEQSRGTVQAEARAREDAVALALKIYREADETGWEQRVQDASARRWVGVPLSPLREEASAQVTAAAPDYRVVATDSSFIAPDKHRGAFSHLINVGRVMVSYGDRPAAELDNTPNHYSEMLVEGEEVTSGRLLQTRCALRELQELLALAQLYRPDVALVDGSLMQLVLVLSKEEHVQALMSEYFRTLRAFRDISVPVVGYISLPESQMVMRAIRMLACDKPVPCERQPEDACGCRPLWSINDADLFWELLDAGRRSAIFAPEFSHLVGQNAPDIKQMVFAYLGTRYEAARLEFPTWVWEDGLLDRASSIALHQCHLGRGYPNCLTLAHQFAALHNVDRESYYFLLERAGLLARTSEKAHGKRVVGQAI